jgi:CRP/FNR family transcriptional regulator
MHKPRTTEARRARGDAEAARDVIRSAAFFQGISDRACTELADATRHRSLRKREVLFLEQTRGDAMYLLTRGSIRLHKTSPDGSEVVVRTVRPGEVFGEVVLFETDRHPVTASALTQAHVLIFGRDAIRGLLDAPAFRDDFITMLMRKQRYLAELVRYLTSCDVQERFLLFLREHYGEEKRITLDIDRKDLAAAIGTTPETLSRLMRRMVKQRLMREEGATLVLTLTRLSPQTDKTC